MKKLNKKFGLLINSRTFSLDGQLKFAKFSGDTNPIHIDPILARRTIVGECIVHGINGLMYAIDSLIKYNGIILNHFDVKFLKPITLDIPIQCFWDGEKNKLSIVSENTILTSIFVKIGPIIKEGNLSGIKSDIPLIYPRNITLKECSEIIREDLIFRGNIEVGKILFPNLFEKYGNIFAAELASTSEIVGMQIPGLNSLFLSIKGDFSERNLISYYQLLSCNLKFGLVKLLVHGRYLKAEIEALYRPSSINSPSIESVSKTIKKNEFENVNALIIGGSRGLGEISAKIIASGGGRVTISYNLGEEDAKQLQQELSNFGGVCDIIKVRIEDGFDIPKNHFNQIYYFPTPKIKAEDPNILNVVLIQLYELFYIHAFRNLLNQVLENNLETSIFYPSSTFLNDPPKNFFNYTDKKFKGELLCKEFIETKSMRIIYPRLPRLATDQTLGLMPEEFEDSVAVMYPFIQRMKC